MGLSLSKGDGGVRLKLQPLVPQSWVELEHLYLRFQQEAHRRRSDPAVQYFIPFPVFQSIVSPLCPDQDKLHLLVMFETLDVKKTHKLTVMDFFSGLALLVDAKKPQKLEFVLSLLDNGGLKTLNKCELTMVVSAAARGLKMFAPGADVLQTAMMRPLIRRLFGDNNEVLRQTVVSKALADPEILFFMSDLEAGVATSSDDLLIQQGKLIRQLTYLDYQAARVKASADRGKPTVGVTTPATGFGQETEAQGAVAGILVPTPESFVRKLQSIVCPPPSQGQEQSMRVLSTVETKKHVDPRTLQRLVNVVSDGALSLHWKEAEALSGEMVVDQFGFVRCGEILRVVKFWMQNRRREEPEALWEIVSNNVVYGLKSVEKHMSTTLASMDKIATKALGSTARRRALVAKSLNNITLNSDTDDGELQWSVNIRVGETNVSDDQVPTSSLTLKRANVAFQNNIRFRLGIHPPNSGDSEVTTSRDKLENGVHVNFDSDDSREEGTMRLFASFLLKTEITDEEGNALASSVEKALQQELVWSSFASLWTKCSATIHSALRSDGGVQPVLGKYLRLCVNFREDFVSNLEECMGVSFAAGIHTFVVLGELDQSLADIIKSSHDISSLLHNLGKRRNRQLAMKMIFDAFDADKSGEWSLQEFNTFQQALGNEALLEVTLADLFGGASTISFNKFVGTYENYSAAKLLEMICQLGIGSLDDLIKGSISITSTVNEPCIKALNVLLSPLTWRDEKWKKLFLFSRCTKDVSLELQYSKLSELIQQNLGHPKLDFIKDPLFVARWARRLEEFVQPPHVEHFKDQPCRSIFCSLEREINKTEQQWEFEDQSRKLTRGTSGRRAEAMIPFLDMATLIKAHVKGLEMLEIRSKNIRIVCEIDNLWMTRPRNTNEDTTATGGN